LLGYPKPEFINALLMRSRLSRTAVSGMPTMMKSRFALGYDTENHGRAGAEKGHLNPSGRKLGLFANGFSESVGLLPRARDFEDDLP
jgi:hypothetical protein